MVSACWRLLRYVRQLPDFARNDKEQVFQQARRQE
jgi:hypothetical protein